MKTCRINQGRLAPSRPAQKLLSSLLLAALLLPVAAWAATGTNLTISGSPVITPSVNISANIANAYTLSQVDANHVKLSGNGTYTYTGTAGGGGTIDVAIGGTFSGSQGNQFSGNYDVTLGLTGSGSLEYQLSASLFVVFTYVQVYSSDNSSSLLNGPSSQQYTGNGTYIDPYSGTLSSNWKADLLLTWTNAKPGDQLTVTIPTNSIDFALLSVPEPSSCALLACGLFAAVGKRRRRG
jgi:hypothetical protein